MGSHFKHTSLRGKRVCIKTIREKFKYRHHQCHSLSRPRRDLELLVFFLFYFRSAVLVHPSTKIVERLSSSSLFSVAEREKTIFWVEMIRCSNTYGTRFKCLIFGMFCSIFIGQRLVYELPEREQILWHLTVRCNKLLRVEILKKNSPIFHTVILAWIDLTLIRFNLLQA